MDEDKQRQGQSIDSVLRQLLRQGRLDPQAERLASQGIDRLRAFLGSDAPAGQATQPDEQATQPDEQDAEVVGADLAPGGREMLMHTVPLADGTRVEVLVPERLTRAEAERIAVVLHALAVDE